VLPGGKRCGLNVREQRPNPAQDVSLAHHPLDRAQADGALVVVDPQAELTVLRQACLSSAGELDDHAVGIEAHDTHEYAAAPIRLDQLGAIACDEAAVVAAALDA
jgi:hypothetical protein